MPEEEAVKEKRKRAVAVEKRIADLNKEDARVTVVGTVLSIDPQALIINIEDPSGELTILCQTEELIKNVRQGSVIRVTGIVLPYEEGIELRAEIIQDFSKLSPELYPVLHNLMNGAQ